MLPSAHTGAVLYSFEYCDVMPRFATAHAASAAASTEANVCLKIAHDEQLRAAVSASVALLRRRGRRVVVRRRHARAVVVREGRGRVRDGAGTGWSVGRKVRDGAGVGA